MTHLITSTGGSIVQQWSGHTILMTQQRKEEPYNILRNSNEFKQGKHIKKQKQTLNREDDDQLQVCMIGENAPRFYSGGRVYAFLLALGLEELGFKVNFITDYALPSWISDFEEFYKLPDISIKNIKQFSEYDDCYAFFGVPTHPIVIASEEGKRRKKDVYSLLFDVPTFMDSEYGGDLPLEWKEKTIWDKISVALEDVTVLACIKTMIPYIKQYSPKSKPVELLSPINSRLCDQIGLQKKKNQVIAISRNVHHKHFDHIIHAVSKVGSKPRLVIVTHAKSAHLEDLARKYNVDLEMFVKIDDYKKFALIKESKVLVHASSFEGLGIPLMEALYCGVPIVCYDFPVFHDLTEGGKGVLFAEYMNPDDLGTKLNQLLGNPDLYDSKCREAQGIANKYSFESYSTRLAKSLNLPTFGVFMIVLNEAEYISYVIRSFLQSPLIKKVVVVECCCKNNEHAANKRGLSKDNTAEIMHKLVDEDARVCFTQVPFKDNHKAPFDDKIEAQNYAISVLEQTVPETDFVILGSGDGIFKQSDILKIGCFIKDNPDVDIISIKGYHFWKYPEIVAVGGQWDSYLSCIYRYKPHFRYSKHHDKCPIPGKSAKLDEVRYYHYGALKKQISILDKLEYYKKRDTHLNIRDTWSDWGIDDLGGEGKKGMSWTHPGGTTTKFTGHHPAIIRDFIEKT